jgi:hypothetical protein
VSTKKAAALPVDQDIHGTTVLPREIELIHKRLDAELRRPFPEGSSSRLGSMPIGIYAFYDYDAEPIYVGQTRELVSTRIRRHLTGMRSDSVAKFVLDPFEVRWVGVWPLPELLRRYPKEKGLS